MLPLALHALLLLPADLPAVIDPLVAPILKDKPAVGLVVGVLVDGKVQVFGYGKVTTPCGEVTPDGTTLFEVGSITKTFTGVLLADAVARKEVKMDDPANDHLPKEFQLKPKGDTPVTLLHGVDDEVVPLRQSEAYAAAHPDATLRAIPGAGHFALVDPESAAWPQVVAAVRDIAGA